MERVYQFPDDVMTDPSLLVSETHTWDTIDTIESQEVLDFYVPHTFHEFMLEEGYQASLSEQADRPPLLRYYAQYADVPNLSNIVPRLTEELTPFQADTYTVQYRGLYTALANSLPYSGSRPPASECEYRDGRSRLVDSAFEEVVFLLERSGWVSRTKRLINDAITAGVHFIELSKDRVDTFLREHTKDRDQVKSDIVKSMGKWVAVSTAGVGMGLLGEPLHGLLSATSVKWAIDASFLLIFDP